MNYGGDIIRGIQELCELFAFRCQDRATLDALKEAAAERARWHEGRALFHVARDKFLKLAGDDAGLRAQFRFEEICGKTLYNLTGQPAPFDADSPYWVVPNALKLARELGISDSDVARIVAQMDASSTPDDRSATIELLEDDVWAPPEFSSHLVTECHRLRKVPLCLFTVENLRIMIGQGIGLPYLIPLALERLKQDPWVAGDFNDGDLLMNVLRVPAEFWGNHSDLSGRLAEIVSVLGERHMMVDTKVLPVWRGIFGGK